jgi:L-malate glycosyltransferase
VNILLITQEDILAGSSFSVSYLAKGLQQRGHHVVVAARGGSVLHEILKDSNVTFEALSIRSRVDWGAIRQLVDLVKTHRIQVINAQSSKDRYITVLAKFFYHLPVILIHTRRQISMSVGGFMQNIIYVKGTDKIVAVSEGVKQSLVSKRIPANHIRVIYNGTPKEKYERIDSLSIQSLKQRFSISQDEIVIGCIARRKKQDQLLRSLDLIGKPVKVILVGIQEDEELRGIRSAWKLPHQIFYEGEVDSQKALNYYGIFTCTILCSVTEGLSQGLLESMYLGVPVIATAAAGNIDLVKHEYNGLLFPDENINALADCIKMIHSNPDLYRKLVSGGITTASDTFSIDRTVHTYEEFYMSLLSSRKIHIHD